jgi:hypothetical protein
MQEFFYTCCQTNYCRLCALTKCDPPILEDKMNVKFHECVLNRMEPNRNTGWDCDGKHHTKEKKCMSGLTGFYQSEHIQGYNCRRCDFDVCLKCILDLK